MPRPVTMPIANDKRRRPERTEAIRVLKPAISNIPRSVSATVAAHANDTVDELGKRDVTAPVYSTKRAKFPQDTFFAPYGPHKPKRSATADRKEAPSANRANRRTISVPFAVSCAVFEFIARRLYIVEERHETVVHVQLLVTVEKRQPWIVSNKVYLGFLVSAQHHNIFQDSGGRLSGQAR